MTKKNIPTVILLILVSVIGIFLRLYHVDFGLPHSFYADEPEIAELAIKYTYEIRDIVKNSNYYKLIPISFVYGTVPAYIFTAFTMAFSKVSNLVGSNFDKMGIYVFLRSTNAIISFLIVPTISYLYYKLFKKEAGTLICFLLLTFNWKLIVHAHYINADILLTLFISLSFLTLYQYFKKESDTKFTVLTGVFLGLAAGTKITALLTFPLYAWVYFRKKDFRGFVALCFLVFGTFALTNPFSIMYITDFVFRIYSMMFKEAGMVFDSVNTSWYKYILAIFSITTLPVVLISLYGKYITLKNLKRENSNDFTFHIFLILNILMYLIFYSIQSRRVDRWMLPIIPIILMYASYGFTALKNNCPKYFFVVIAAITAIYYLYFPTLLLTQFKRDTPKSEAYIWMQKNIPEASSKLIYTEEGLDPMNKLLGERVIKFEVYTSENAQFFVPENPEGYEYVVISSRPMENFKRPEVKKAYPFFVEKWENFEKQILNQHKFVLIKEFTLPKPNLIPLSDVCIYKNLNPVTTVTTATTITK